MKSFPCICCEQVQLRIPKYVVQRGFARNVEHEGKWVFICSIHYLEYMFHRCLTWPNYPKLGSET